MGKYTALDDPFVEDTVEDHMQRIVTEITSQMDAQSIILRGSFGRDEGSVLVQDNKIRFLSDYEIDVATFSPRYRSLFAMLSQKLSTELGVTTSLRWVRPDFLTTKRVGPIPMGPATSTISLYESRYGTRTLYGLNIAQDSPAIYPDQIISQSATRLILNRMAEALNFLPKSKSTNNLEILYWINKTILACAESLLLLWGQYHYSYKERGQRFALVADGQLDFLGDQATTICELVNRATEFKLHPRQDLYQNSIEETWHQVIPICDLVFRYLTKQIYDFSFREYDEFPDQFLQCSADIFKSLSPLQRISLKLLDIYKYSRTQRIPRGLFLPFTASQIVYSVVPLLFVGWVVNKDKLVPFMREARRHLQVICQLAQQKSDPWDEYDTMRQVELWAWKNFCVS
jgi:hypothetical protein